MQTSPQPCNPIPRLRDAAQAAKVIQAFGSLSPTVAQLRRSRTMNFEGAPVCRIVLCGGLASTFFLPSNAKQRLALDLGVVLARGELARLLTHHWAFDGLGEAALGSIALFRMRRFERYLGSRKFVGFVAVTQSIATLLLVGGAALFNRRSYGQPYFAPASGPYALIFGLFALFHKLVPVAQPQLVRMLGVTLSDKSLMYLVGAQLFICQGKRSAAPAACGLLAGCLYLSDTLPFLRSLRLPRFLEPLFAPRRSAAPAPPAPDEVVEAAPAPPAEERFQNVQPSDDHVASLVSMGFDRDRAFAALLACHDDVAAAADRLLQG